MGIYEPIHVFLAPIFPVIKNNWFIRIFSDSRQSVDKVLSCVKYLIFKTEYILATLILGDKFTELYLLQAYQQLILGPDSRD